MCRHSTFLTQLHEIHRRPYRRQRTVAVGGNFIRATDLAALAEIPHIGRLPNYFSDFRRLVYFAQAHLRSAAMQTDKGAGKLNRAVGAHIDQVRSGTTRKLLRESVIAVKLVVVLIEAHALVFFLEFRNVISHAVERFVFHLDVFSLPRCAHDVVNGFGMQQKLSLFAELCQCRQVFELVEVDGRVDLNRVMIQLAEDMVQRFEDYRQAIDASAFGKLFAVERVYRDFELIEFDASLSVFLQRETIRGHRRKETSARRVFDKIRHVRIHQRLAAREAPREHAELCRLVHARKDTLANGAILRLLVLPDRAVAALHIAMQRRLEHHHERTIESMAQLPQSIPEHQTFLHAAKARVGKPRIQSSSADDDPNGSRSSLVLFLGRRIEETITHREYHFLPDASTGTID